MDEVKTRIRKRGSGEGTISQRQDGRWVGTITLGFDTFTCKQIRKSVVRKTRAEVATELQKMLAEKKKNTTNTKVDKNITVEEWLDTWINKYKKVSIKQTTLTKYESTAKYVNLILGKYKLNKLTHFAVQNFINVMHNEKKLAARTTKTCISVLSNSLNFAIRLGILEKNVCELVEKPVITKKQMKIFSAQELLKFKDVCKNHYLEAAMHLLLHGMRRGEVLGMTVENLHLDEGFLSVANNLVITNEGVKLEQTPKTSASARDIPLTHETIELLRAHIENKKSGLVFTTSKGNYVHPRSFQRSFDILLKKAGLQKIRLHDMRHSCASLLLTNGCDLRSVSELLGHADTKVTTDIYLHSNLVNKKQAISVLDKLLTE